MVDLHENLEEATAGTTVTLNVDKPEGGKLVIRRISLWTAKTFAFARIYGWLFNRQHGATRKGLFNKVYPQDMIGKATPIWDGSDDWPEGYRLSITTKSQMAAEVFHFTISYEKGVPLKKGWGQG